MTAFMRHANKTCFQLSANVHTNQQLVSSGNRYAYYPQYDMIDRLPESQMIFVINMLEGLSELSGANVHPEFTPNAETLEAFAETDEMIRSSSGQHFKGNAEDFFAMLDAEE